MPEVSIIVPNYNHAPYLNQRIDSVLSQTFQDFELIILDDNSTDNSREILSQYSGHPKVSHIIFNDQNSGSTFIQWEKGVKLAKGNFIWIAESDDYCTPDLLEYAIQYFSEDDRIGICQFNCLWVDDNNNEVYQENIIHEDYTIPGKQFLLNHMLLGNAIYNASSAIFKKSLIEGINFQVLSNFKYCGDWLLWLEILKKSHIKIDPRNLNFYRRHEKNVSGKSEASGLAFIEGIKVYQEIKKAFPNESHYDRSDIEWAIRLSKRSFSLKVTIKALKKLSSIHPLLFSNWLISKIQFKAANLQHKLKNV